MTREEKIEILKERARELLEWFEVKRELPVAPFPLTPWAQVINSEKFYKKQMITVEHYKDNPLSAHYVQAYKNLQHLREYLEANQKIVTHATVIQSNQQSTKRPPGVSPPISGDEGGSADILQNKRKRGAKPKKGGPQ